MDTRTLGQRVLARRKELRLTQREAARLAGVAHVTVPAQELHVETELTPNHKELIELFDALPSSEQEALLSEMRARVENFNKLFEEMLKARKNKSIK